MYVLGGIGEKSVESLNLAGGTSDNGKRWQTGPPMPDVSARACAVGVGKDNIIVVGKVICENSCLKQSSSMFSFSGGHDNSSTNSLPTAHKLSVSTGKWTKLPEMKHPRRDHACVFVEFETTSGILVTGGLGDDDEVLDSAEFFDLKTKKWTLTSSLKQGRTEHSMSIVYGIPTVIGGNRLFDMHKFLVF